MEENEEVIKKTVKKTRKKIVNKTINPQENTNNSKIKEYINFYSKNIRLKHIIIFVIMLVIFAISITWSLSNINTIKELTNIGNVQKSLFDVIIKEKIPIVFLVIFAGITPYLYISLLGLFFPFMIATNIMMLSGFGIAMGIIGAVIQMLGISLAVAIGMYYCGLSSKSFRYSQTTSFGLNDVKRQLYQIRKNEKKVEEIEKKMIDKRQRTNALNVKTPYKKLFVLGLAATIITIIATIIAGV